jgi:rod shape-determining protein MreD
MGILAAFPVLILASIVQVVIGSRLQLIHGSVDLVLLILVSWALQERAQYAWVWALIGGIIISIFSAISPAVIIGSYLIVTIMTRMFQRRMWQMPLLALLVMCFVGTIILHLFSILTLQISGINIDFVEGIRLVTLPSTLLNLLVALPIYTVMTDFANWIYPLEVNT